MTPKDDVLFQQARDWYNTGKKRKAYEQFRALSQNNPKDAALLCWLGFSTPNLDEARRAVEDVELLNPNHPSLPKLRKRVSRLEWQAVFKPTPRQYMLQQKIRCPYCGYEGRPLIIRKVSMIGWIIVSVLLLVCFPLYWVGLFFRKNICVCIKCTTELGDISGY